MLSQQLSSKGTCAPKSQFPAMGPLITRDHVSWVSSSTLEASSHTDADERFGIDSGACSFQIFYEHRAVSQISVQGFGFLSSSHQRHVPGKLKTKKISPTNIFFLESFLAVLAPATGSSCTPNVRGKTAPGTCTGKHRAMETASPAPSLLNHVSCWYPY